MKTTTRVALAVVLAAVPLTPPASAGEPRSGGRERAAKLAGGPAATAEDVGDVAVVVDNGLMVTARNPFDLPSPTTLRFEPAGTGAFTVSRSADAMDPAFGPDLTFGYPGATLFPGDDDSQEVSFPAGFPYFGTTHASVFVNTDGNVTFGEPEFASTNRDKPRHALGPPRISAFFHDWNAHNALNPGGSGSIHATVKSSPDRLVVTWNAVADFSVAGGANTFQLTLYSNGTITVTLLDIDVPSQTGVVGLARGHGEGALVDVDFSKQASPRTVEAGAIVEAFAPLTVLHPSQIVSAFYETHPDHFDFVTIFTDFGVSGSFQSLGVSSQTHGIGARIDPFTGSYVGSTVVDESASWGSGGELEQIVLMNNVFFLPADEDDLVAPPVEPYQATSNILLWPEVIGFPVTFDGQPMSQIRITGTLPNDDGEFAQNFARSGPYSLWTWSSMVVLAHEVAHRWLAQVRFLHPAEGEGFGSYDLLGRDGNHWSFFVNTAVPDAQFPDAPRSSVSEGNHIVDLGTPSTYGGTALSLATGERVFEVPDATLADGYSAVDQYLMGMRRAEDTPPFFYVDDPKSIYTGESLDPFNPANVMDTSVTMRGWTPRGGIAFKGKRIDLDVDDLQAFEKTREGSENPKGRRFWGPKGTLKVRYDSATRLVTPNGDAAVTLSESERELGDEADAIDAAGRPVDVKTIAFVLLVRDGSPSSHGTAIDRVDAMRRAFEDYANGPATGGRGRFDTSLTPAVH